MEESMLTQLKNKYRLALFTEEGEDILNDVKMRRGIQKEILKNWTIHEEAFLDTQDYIPTILRSSVQKVPIIPIGFNNQCHFNAEKLCGDGFTRVVCLQITPCTCGAISFFAIHSVNQYKGEMYDFTHSLQHHKHSHIIPIRCSYLNNTEIVEQLYKLGLLQGVFVKTHNKCSCGTGRFMTVEKLVSILEHFKTYKP